MGIRALPQQLTVTGALALSLCFEPAGEAVISLGNPTQSIEEAQRQDVPPARRDHSVVDGQCRVSDGRECILPEQHEVM